MYEELLRNLWHSKIEGTLVILPIKVMKQKYSSPPYPQFQLHMVNSGLKILNGNSRNEQPISFKLHAILSSERKFYPFPLHLAREVSHALVQGLNVVYVFHSFPCIAVSVITSTVAVLQSSCSGNCYCT